MNDALSLDDLERLTGCTVDRSTLPEGWKHEETPLPITKEFLLREIEAMERQREGFFANYHAAGGAIQTMKQLLDQMDAPDADKQNQE